MVDNVIEDIINKYEGIMMRLSDIEKEMKQLDKDVHDFYNFLYSFNKLFEG